MVGTGRASSPLLIKFLVVEYLLHLDFSPHFVWPKRNNAFKVRNSSFQKRNIFSCAKKICKVFNQIFKFLCCKQLAYLWQIKRMLWFHKFMQPVNFLILPCMTKSIIAYERQAILSLATEAYWHQTFYMDSKYNQLLLHTVD